MAQTYIYCDALNVGQNVSVSLTKGDCNLVYEWQRGLEFNRIWIQEMTFSIPTALNEDLRVWYEKVEDINDDYGSSGTFTTVGSVIIPEGQTEITIDIDCKQEQQDDFGAGGLAFYSMDLISFELIEQQQLPSCVVGGCTHSITGATSTPTSVRNTPDGTITVGVDGTTGSTHTWTINGVTKFTGGTVQTFTGLTAGSYVIAIIQAECVVQQTVVVEDGDFRTGTMSVNTPAVLTASNNPIIFNASTAINSPSPLKSISRFAVTGSVAEDVEIKIELDFPLVYVATFNSRGYPYRGNFFLATQLKSPTGSVVGENTAQEIATSLAEVLQNDLVIGRLYEIWADDIYVYLRSYEANGELDLEDAVTIVGSNVTFMQTQAGRAQYDGELVEDYSVYAELFVNPILQFGQVPDLSNFIRVGEIELPFQSNNQHFFDLSQTLRNFTTTPKLDFTFSGFTTYVDMMAGYYLNYGEKYPLIRNTATKKKRVKGQTDVQYVINSALNYEDKNDMTSYLGKQISGLNPLFDYTRSGYNFTFVDTTLSGYTVNSLQYRVRQGSGNQSIVVHNWQSGNTFTLTDGTYWIDVSGQTQVDTGTTYNATVSRRLVFTTALNGIYWDTSKQPTPLRYMDVKFLTNSPTPKQVHRNSTEYLGFILPATYPSGLKVYGNLEFYNGTSLSNQELFTITSLIVTQKNFGGVIMLAVGYDKLGLETYENAGQTKIRKVEIWIENTDTGIPMTETKTYLYEIDEQPRRFGTAFLNKLGTYDIFDWQGEVVEESEVGFQEYQQPRNILIDGSSSKGFKYNAVYDKRYYKLITVNSGSINEATYDWLQEILQSNVIYNYTEDNQPFLTVENYTANKSTNENEYFMQVQFRATIHENNVKV